ncbi:hypothetical protein MLD38_032732 [Melastoma candidum]|uniref:Uncharacterized protein n=1 Tax=Melastoma candidum TaxID=119954 RepID=A0ACB9M4I7_9MYRT|nr:hypothetical protein MLD38_032732 [Melastoma candidum]
MIRTNDRALYRRQCTRWNTNCLVHNNLGTRRREKRLSPGLVRPPPGHDNWGWNTTSDPCVAGWKGVRCDLTSQFIQRIVLEGLNFSGEFNVDSLCVIPSLGVISLKNNNLTGGIPGTISKCKRLTHLYLGGNRLSGQLPDGLSKLKNLNRLDVSNNEFSGGLPSLERIPGLITFLAQNNRLSGELPLFKLANFHDFNVSNNNFTGPIPDSKGPFRADSFRDNPGLCGSPLSIPCPTSPSPQQSSSPSPLQQSSKKRSFSSLDAYFGYMIIGLLVLAFIIYKITRKLESKKERKGNVKRKESAEYITNSSGMPNVNSRIHEISESRSELSITSAESGAVSLVVFPGPVAKNLKFEDLLRSPAELLGRGKHGTLYKVILNNGLKLAVKRIKNWRISPEEFDRRMHKVERVKHPNVMPPIAFYCSKQEMLLVYQYHRNGNLFSLLHERRGGEAINWASRLTIAAAISNGLAFMHLKLQDDGIPHGNIKSTNILFDEEAEPCLSEYGLMPVDGRDPPPLSENKTPDTSENYGDESMANESLALATRDGVFKDDVYGFGTVLLELLTGKMVQNDGQDLVKWVHLVVKEEWTAEVFDRALLSEGGNEERMVKLLQVAVWCISEVPGERPSMGRVAEIINAIKEEQEKSSSYDTLTL